MSQLPLNSKSYFDLGNVNNVTITGTSSDIDKVLVLKYDNVGKYRLETQQVPKVISPIQRDIVIGAGKSFFHN